MIHGTHAIQSLTPKSLPGPRHGEPHCDSMSQNSVVVLWALGTCRLHRFWSCRVCACWKEFSRQQVYSFYSFQQEFLTKDPFGGYNIQENLEMQIGLQLWPPLILGLMCAHMCTFTFLFFSASFSKKFSIKSISVHQEFLMGLLFLSQMLYSLLCIVCVLYAFLH